MMTYQTGNIVMDLYIMGVGFLMNFWIELTRVICFTYSETSKMAQDNHSRMTLI